MVEVKGLEKSVQVTATGVTYYGDTTELVVWVDDNTVEIEISEGVHVQGIELTHETFSALVSVLKGLVK